MKLTCPTKNRLREFLEGSVSDGDADQISDHVEDCQTCDLVLSTLEGEQSDLLKELREGIRTESLLQEPEFEKLRNTARFSQSDTTASADVDEHPQTGKRLRDYRLVKKIGEGGMGTVYQAFHVHLAKHVALKILPSDKLRSKQSVARFRQEMRAVGQVNHPNVVSASDAGTIDGQHFLVMELVQGADLARIIHDRGPLKVAEACEIVRQAAIGLQHAHDNGLVHRDVKPSNIMLALNGSVKLLDLGLAGLNNSEFESTANVVVTDRLTSVGQIMGTLDYMAPEQITASPEVDGRADIYALGATLFQLLTGRTPCGDRSEETPQRIEAVLHKPPLDIRALRNDVPEELCTLLLKMLAKKPEDRPVAAIDVASELTRFASDADLDALAEECRTSLDMPSADVDVTDDVSFVVSRGKHPQDKGNSKRTFTAVGLAGCFLALVAAIVYYIQTNNGTVRVEVLDETLQVTIDGQAVTMKERNKQPIKLRPGPHKLVVSQGETEFLTDNFEIRRNDKLAFKVDLFPGEVVLNMEGRGPKPKTLRGAVPLHLNTELGSSNQTEKERKEIEKVSATALVNGCEVTGGFTAEQAELIVKNPTREGKSVAFFYQVVYQNSRDRDDIFQLTGGLFEGTVLPGREVIKRVDILGTNSSKPLNYLKDLLVIRVYRDRLKDFTDIPIDPNKKLDVANQPVAIASQTTPGYSATAARKPGGPFGKLWPEFSTRVLPENTTPGDVSPAQDPGQAATEENHNADQIVQRLTETHGHLVPKLQKMFSEAAGVPNAQWQKFSADPTGAADAIKGKPLSLVLWKLNPLQESTKNLMVLEDFQYIGGIPKPRQLSDAMFPSHVDGYYSILQPAYISGLTYEVKAGSLNSAKLSGNFRFQAPKLYAGKVDFVVQVNADSDLQVTEFSLPNYGIRLVRDDDGIWLEKSVAQTDPDTDRAVKELIDTINSLNKLLDRVQDGTTAKSVAPVVEALSKKIQQKLDHFSDATAQPFGLEKPSEQQCLEISQCLSRVAEKTSKLKSLQNKDVSILVETQLRPLQKSISRFASDKESN